jgi:hypothetical protein
MLVSWTTSGKIPRELLQVVVLALAQVALAQVAVLAVLAVVAVPSEHFSEARSEAALGICWAEMAMAAMGARQPARLSKQEC